MSRLFRPGVGYEPVAGRGAAVTEFGSVEDPANPSRRANWIADAQALFQTAAYSRYAGVMYFNPEPNCDWRVETSCAALAAFEATGADPYDAG